MTAGARAAIAYQKETLADRRLQQLNTIALKQDLAALDIPVVPGPSHIVPALVGDAGLAKEASDLLLTDHKIYVQLVPCYAFDTSPLTFCINQIHQCTHGFSRL